MKRLGLREPQIALLFLIPAVFGLAVFYYYPILQSFLYSAFDLDHTTDWVNADFVGLGNYVEVFKSREFWRTIGFTLWFTVATVFLEFWVGMGLALATFWVWPRLRGVLRGIIVIPWAIPQIILSSRGLY